MAQTNFTLKLQVDTRGHRVLFAEAGKDFVDFLVNILSLPFGTVIRLLTKEGMVGCLGNLYDGIENLRIKDRILNPKAPNSGGNLLLSVLPNVETPTSRKMDTGGRCHHKQYGKRKDDEEEDTSGEYEDEDEDEEEEKNPRRVTCPKCKRLMSRPASYVAPPVENKASSSKEGGFVKGVVTYMVMDDLVVKPLSTLSIITILKQFNIKEVEALEEKVIDINMDGVCHSSIALCDFVSPVCPCVLWLDIFSMTH